MVDVGFVPKLLGDTQGHVPSFSGLFLESGARQQVLVLQIGRQDLPCLQWPWAC